MTRHREGRDGGPGSRLWLIKWLLVAGLVVLLLLILSSEREALAFRGVSSDVPFSRSHVRPD